MKYEMIKVCLDHRKDFAFYSKCIMMPTKNVNWGKKLPELRFEKNYPEKNTCEKLIEGVVFCVSRETSQEVMADLRWVRV